MPLRTLPFLSVPFPLVVISDFYLVRAVNFPDETDPVLLVDSDAVLPHTVALQRFQPISWRHAQIASSGWPFQSGPNLRTAAA